MKALSLCSYHYVLLQDCIKEDALGNLDDVKEK